MYCKNCGNEITNNAKICTKCGLKVEQVKNMKSPVIAAILSFFIIGLGQIYNKQIKKGVILFFSALLFSSMMPKRPIFAFVLIIVWIYALFDSYNTAKGINIDIIDKLRKAGIPGFRSGKKTNMIIIVVCIFLIITIISSPSNTSRKFPQTDSLITPIKTSNPIQSTIETTKGIPTSTPISDKDKKFFQWVESSTNILSNDIRKITDSASRSDMTGIGSNGRILKEDSLKYLDEMEMLDISPNVRIIFEKYKDLLANNYNTGLYAELGGKESNTEYINNAADYMKKGTDQAKDITDMIKSGTWKTKIPEELDLTSISISNENNLLDIAGYYNVFGVIKNGIDSNIKYVKISAMFYNSNGDPIGYDYAYQKIGILKSGQTSPFQLSSYPAKLEDISKYKLSVDDYMKTDEVPYEDFEILSHSMIDKTGHKNIIGKIKNNGNQKVKFDISAILYDDKDATIDIKDQVPSVNIGSTGIGDFDILYLGDISPKRYDILVQKSRYQ